MIGSVLDKYRILEKIGEGGMASVYRGEHITLGREVAVKILHPHLSTQARNRQRFAREARAIENLRHDNILRIEDYSGETADDCYIVTEFVDGETLRQLLADHGAFPSEITALVGLHLADALQYAHDLGIIHRDLKPENVMIKKDGTLKLMDFGIARFLDEMHLTLTGALVGSPAYMSPEQAMERVLDSRSDLFSLGTLLFHLVTGQLPFAGNNPSIVLRNIIEGNRPSVSDLAPGVAIPLADLIHSLLQTDPSDRPSSALEVRQRLVAILAEVQLDSEDPTWSLQTWLVDPAGYSDRLDQYLADVLLTHGKARLEARDHLGALQFFNRLLTIDEHHGRQNEEVLALVQGMHGAIHKPRGAATLWLWGVGLVVAAALLTWLLWPSPPLTPDQLSSTQAPVVTDTTSAAGASASPPAMPDLDPPAPQAQQPLESQGSIDSLALGTAAETPVVAGSTTAPPAPKLVLRRDPLPAAMRAEPHLRQAAAAPQPTAPAGATALKSNSADNQGESGSSTGAAGTSASSPGPQTPASTDALAPGFLTVHVPHSWAHIYIDGSYKGRTGASRDPIRVAPGTHLLTVKNDFAFPHEEQFTIAPGETRNIETPELQRRPATVIIDDKVSLSCTLSLDGTVLGHLETIGRKLQLQVPTQRHLLVLDCPEGLTEHQVGPLLDGETVTIP